MSGLLSGVAPSASRAADRAARGPPAALLDLLGVEPGRICGSLARRLGLLAAVAPYDLASQLAQLLLGVPISGMGVWRVVQRLGPDRNFSALLRLTSAPRCAMLGLWLAAPRRKSLSTSERVLFQGPPVLPVGLFVFVGAAPPICRGAFFMKTHSCARK